MCCRSEDASDSFVMEDDLSSPFRLGLRMSTPGSGVGPPGQRPDRLPGERGQVGQVPQAGPGGVGVAINDKSTLKVYLPNGGFNIVKFGDATDIKVSYSYICGMRDVSWAAPGQPG